MIGLISRLKSTLIGTAPSSAEMAQESREIKINSVRRLPREKVDRMGLGSVSFNESSTISHSLSETGRYVACFPDPLQNGFAAPPDEGQSILSPSFGERDD